MDSGFLEPGETIEESYDVMRQLLPEEVLGIMDQLLCCEMAWHQGYPLSQTIFASHYIDKIINSAGVDIATARFRLNNPSSKDYLVDLALHAYCLSLIKTCDLVIQKINSTHFYEEEDFSTNTYGRDLLPDISLTDLQDYLQSTLEVIEKECPELERTKLWIGIRSRLLLRSLFHNTMNLDEVAPSEYWQTLSSLLPLLKETNPLGTSVPSAFSPKIQRRLASTVPPRPMVELSFENAYDTLSYLCSDCSEATRIINIQPDSAEQLKALLWSFSARKPEPLPYSRAYLSAPILSCDDQGFEQLLRTDLSELVFPADSVLDPTNWTFEPPQNPGTTPDPRFEIANTVSNFTASVVAMMGGYVDFFRALCSNRCRLRRNLTHIAQGLEHVRLELTDNLDVVLRNTSPETIPNPLETWAQQQKIRIMEWVVLLGFELDVYLTDEFASMYWYLSRLANHRLRILESLESLTSKRYQSIRTRGLHALQASEISRSLTFVKTLLHEARGVATLASGLHHLYTCLSYLGCIPAAAQNSKYKDPRKQWEIRFKPFLTIGDPRLPAFEEFQQVLTPHGSFENPSIGTAQIVDNCIGTVDKYVKEARDNFAALKRMGKDKALCSGVENWDKVCFPVCFPSYNELTDIDIECFRTARVEHSIGTIYRRAEDGGLHDQLARH